MTARKKVLRGQLRDLRRALAPDRKEVYDRLLLHRLLALDVWRRAKMIFCYLSTPEEVDTRPVLEAAWAAGKATALPRCLSRTEMAFYAVSDLSGLALSPFGIWEPSGDDAQRFPPMDPVTAADSLIIVPGLAFDRQGFRLGYGGGYYDRLLAGCTAPSVGLCYPELLLQTLPVCAHDQPVSVVLTPDDEITPQGEKP